MKKSKRKSIIHLLVSIIVTYKSKQFQHKVYFLFDLEFCFSTLTIFQRTFNKKNPTKISLGLKILRPLFPAGCWNVDIQKHSRNSKKNWIIITLEVFLIFNSINVSDSYLESSHVQNICIANGLSISSYN
jgi:hypothetical protein